MKNLSAVDLNLLVAFDALLTERNVTRAAQRIGLSQPALSKALSRLREVFDDPLFERRDGVMQPTAQAVALGKPVRRALDEIQSALPSRDFDPGKARATVTIGSLDFYDLVILPPLTARLRHLAPGIDLVVKRTDRLRVHRQFASSEIDFAIIPLSESITELHADPLFGETAVTLIAKDNPLARELTLERFAEAGHVAVAVEGQGIGWIDSVLAARGLQRRIVLTLPNFAVVPFVVGTSDLISTLPQRLAARLADAARIVALPPPLPSPTVIIHLASHPRSTASPLLRWMRAVIKDVAATV